MIGSEWQARFSQYYWIKEHTLIQELRAQLQCDAQFIASVENASLALIQDAKNHPSNISPIQTLLHEYNLSSDEGLALMSLTEALMRIPDEAVASQLIADKIKPLDWAGHSGKEQSSLINASTFLLAVSGKLLTQTDEKQREHYAHRFVRRLSQPLIRGGITQVLKVIADQFVFAEDIDHAIARIENEDSPLHYSVDMLGEASVNHAQAQDYFEKYLNAIKSIGEAKQQERSSVSIKLSALHPHYRFQKQEQCVTELVDTILKLYEEAQFHGIHLTIDAEEANRLELSLEVLDSVSRQATLSDKASLGLAVQAYSKRALTTLNWLKDYAIRYKIRLPVRLVKGAYWDSEIKYAQQMGHDDYPVFTDKWATDLSYLSCAQFMIENDRDFYPQFATHNATSISHIALCAQGIDYEFQRLHGMGEALFDCLKKSDCLRESDYDTKVRVYAPVGQHRELLPYLVRRILENGANNSFVNQMNESDIDISTLATHPLTSMEQTTEKDVLPRPRHIFQPHRDNSKGLPLESEYERKKILEELAHYRSHYWEYLELSTAKNELPQVKKINSVCDGREIGELSWCSAGDALASLKEAKQAYEDWSMQSLEARADILIRFAELLEANRLELEALLCEEAGKTIEDADSEVRETIDFAYYYSKQGMESLKSQHLPSIDGETNELMWRGKGVFLCISPWNFPLAIYMGQVCAALMAGNCVLAKPAEQTSLIAHKASSLLHEAGVPKSVFHLLPGEGKVIGQLLCEQPDINGVAFTGSTQTAKAIEQTLANRDGAIGTLIAETGGQNAMIVDSSAVLEQLVQDVVNSAFSSAGQRCSALRMLYIQKDIFESFKSLLTETVQELHVGDPRELKTDVGPIIDSEARSKLEQHTANLYKSAELVCSAKQSSEAGPANLLLPHVFEIKSITELGEEHFGPILHIAPFAYDEVDKVIEDINSLSYGLTFGIHSRNEQWAKSIAKKVNAGNVYLNRNIIGAVVGSQPFGGMGLSGTGPKAGGPHYLQRFATEVTLTNNIAAIGGNVKLLS